MRKVAICVVGLMAGWLAASALASGSNQIRIAVPTHALASTAKHPRSYTVSVHGFSRHSARAYLFIDYTGCAKSFSAEYKRTGKAGRARWAVDGTFDETSYWGSDGAGLDHACGYLMATGTATMLARSDVTFRIYAQH